MPKIKVPAKVKANAKLFLQSLEGMGEELYSLSNLTLAERLAEGEIDEATFMAVESWAESVKWGAKLDGSTPESNQLLAIGGRSAQGWIKESGDIVRESSVSNSGYKLREDGSYVRRIRIASPGMGSSGYYPEDALKRSESAFPKGTRILNSHVMASDRVKKSGLALDDLLGETIQDAVFENHPTEGPGLYTTIEIFPNVVKKYGLKVIEKSQFSMYTRGLWEREKMNVGGRLVPVVHKLVNTPHTSVDAVLIAGRGGKFVAENGDGTKINMQIATETLLPEQGASDDQIGTIQLCVICPDEEIKETGIDANEETMTIEELKAQMAVLEAEKTTLAESLNTANASLNEANKRILGFEAKTAIETALQGVTFINDEAGKTVRTLLQTTLKVEGGKLDTSVLMETAKSYQDGTSQLVMKEDANQVSDEAQVTEAYILPEASLDLFSNVGQAGTKQSAPVIEMADEQATNDFLSAEITF